MKRLLLALMTGAPALLAACSSREPIDTSLETVSPDRVGAKGDKTSSQVIEAVTAERLAAACGADAAGVINAEGAISCLPDNALSNGGGARSTRAPEGSPFANTSTTDLVAPTHYLSIPAIACMPQGTARTGDPGDCLDINTVRTDGDLGFPCRISSRTVRDTYICHLPLPTGTIIEEIIAYGLDHSPVGYLEAAVWGTNNDVGYAPFYISGFGGKWQNSGIAFSGNLVSFPIFSSSDPPHTVQAGARYTIGFATKSPDLVGTVFALGFRVRYRSAPSPAAR